MKIWLKNTTHLQFVQTDQFIQTSRQHHVSQNDYRCDGVTVTFVDTNQLARLQGADIKSGHAWKRESSRAPFKRCVRLWLGYVRGCCECAQTCHWRR